MTKSLYICYFGVREPLVQTQVIPYLRELLRPRPRDAAAPPYQGGELNEISLLTFEPEFKTKWNAAELAEMRERLLAEGIDWHYLPYHKRPSAVATAWDIFRGAVRVWRLNRRKRFDILHCRVHVPGVMADLARTFSRHKPKMLFDIRGFFPEEFVDAGLWPADGIIFRAAKRVEKRLMKVSDGFVVLTEKARDILFPESRENGFDKRGRPVEVIPCCVDIGRFAGADEKTRAAVRAELGAENRYIIIYVGSFGGWYMTDEMMGLFAAARETDRNAFALVLTQRDTEKIAGEFEARGFASDDFFVTSVGPNEVYRYMAAGDAALSFIKPCYSKQSSSPTKLAEYLACGLPIIANRGVGDVDELIEKNGVGVMTDEFSPESYANALAKIRELGNIADQCRKTARREFDLEKVGGTRYRRLYRALAADSIK